MSVMLIHNDSDTAYNANGFAIGARATRFFFDTSIDVTTNQNGLITAMHVDQASYHPFSADNYGNVPEHNNGTQLLVQIADTMSALNSNSSDILSNNTSIVGGP